MSNKANKEAPPQYDFQFAEGFKSYQPCRYWKNDFGEVTISLAEFENLIELSPNTRYLIGTMPKGYLPDQQSFGTGLCNTADSARCFANGAGQVYFYPSTEVGAGSKWNTGIIKYMALAE